MARKLTVLAITFPAALLLAIACERPAGDHSTQNSGASPRRDNNTQRSRRGRRSHCGRSQPASQPASQATTGAGVNERAARGYGATPPNIPDGETRHYGADFSSDSAPLSLHDAIEACGDNGRICKLTGTIASSCQTRGCWFVLNAPDVDRVVRIRMQDYGFFVPRNSAGSTAIVEGTIEAVTLPVEMARHYAEDAVRAGEEAREVTGPEEAWQIMITGAELTKAPGG